MRKDFEDTEMTPTTHFDAGTITPLPLQDPEVPDTLGERIDDCGPGAPHYKIEQVEWSDEMKERLADRRWLNDQINDGAMDAYSGEFVAVVEKRMLGHHKNPHQLRKEVSESTGIPEERIVAIFVDRNIFW
jgi:hypothetical protein